MRNVFHQGTESVGGHPGFGVLTGPINSGERTANFYVEYDPNKNPFRSPHQPHVFVSMERFDINSGSPRYDMRVIASDDKGFNLTITTWGDTSIANIRISYLSYVRPED